MIKCGAPEWGAVLYDVFLCTCTVAVPNNFFRWRWRWANSLATTCDNGGATYGVGKVPYKNQLSANRNTSFFGFFWQYVLCSSRGALSGSQLEYVFAPSTVPYQIQCFWSKLCRFSVWAFSPMHSCHVVLVTARGEKGFKVKVCSTANFYFRALQVHQKCSNIRVCTSAPASVQLEVNKKCSNLNVPCGLEHFSPLYSILHSVRRHPFYF